MSCACVWMDDEGGTVAGVRSFSHHVRAQGHHKRKSTEKSQAYISPNTYARTGKVRALTAATGSSSSAKQRGRKTAGSVVEEKSGRRWGSWAVWLVDK